MGISGVHDGTNTITIDIPDDAADSRDYVVARFRLGTHEDTVNDPTGETRDGEVEDYRFPLVRYLKDYGDAPSSYPVSEADNGAWHSTNGLTEPDVADVYLGLIPPDSELDGVASPNADADDLNRTENDEDGVTVYGLSLEHHVFVADGNDNTISVTVTGVQKDGAVGNTYKTAYLRAWLDLDANGEWDVTNDLIIDDTFLPAEFGATTDGSITRHYDFSIPALSSDLGDQAVSYARFRVSSQPGLRHDNLDGPGGNAIEVEDGEVEDYQVFIVNEARDYGDAPDGISGLASYPTLISSNGASHAVGALMLGDDIDADYDAHSNATATGDDLVPPDGAGDDEDGILFDEYSRFVPGGTATIDVDVTKGLGVDAYLYGWIDFNRDGDWDDEGEQIFGDATGGFKIAAGIDSIDDLSIEVPGLYDPTDPTAPYSELGDTYARFRLNSDPAEILSYDGYSANGEVEDYMVTIEIGDATIQGKKFNDLDADGVYDSSVQGAIPPITLDTIGIGPTVLNNTDDAWSANVDLGFQFEYYGNTYSRLYVSPNGLVSFRNPGQTNPSADPGFPSNLPVIAPFWANADLTSSGGTVHASHGTNPDSGNPFVQIDWNEVGFYDRSSGLNPDLRNTFSLYIEDAPAGDIVAFVYDTMQWTTGDNDGTDGFGGFGAEIGFNAGDGVQYYSEMRPNSQQGLTALLDQADENGVLGYRMDPTTGLLAKGEPGLAGVTVYLDYNGNGNLDVGEPSTVTRPDDLSTPDIDETGDFEFTGLFSGSYTVREDLSELDGIWIQTHPAAGPTYLPDVNGDKIQAIDGSNILDEDIFLVSNGIDTIQLEFDDDGILVGGASVAVEFSGLTEIQVAEKIQEAINNEATAQGINLLASVDPVNYPGVVMLTIPTADPAAVVSIDPQDTMLTVLGDTHINDDRSYTVVVDVGETNSEVLFGNHKLTTISVGNVSVAEGDEGETKVNLTFERRGSFGAEVTVDFHTENGSLTDDDFNAHYEIAAPDGYDYERIEEGSDEGTFTFLPQDEPQATWDLQAITHNQTNDYDYHVSGDTIVFEVADENDWEILVYNDTVGGDPIALTDNDVEDRFADLYRVGTGLSGTIYAVWAGIDSNPGQTDYEIFLSEITVGPGGLTVGTPIQVTDNDTDDKSPRVSDSHVTWWGFDEVAGDQEIFMSSFGYTTDTPPVFEVSEPVNISDNDYDDFDPGIDGDRVVWHALVGQGTEIFLYDGSATRRVTNNQLDNSAPQIDGNVIVWQGRHGVDLDIFYYEIDTWNTTQLTFDDFDDKAPQLSGENIVWEGGPASYREIYLYNIADAGTPANISDNSFLDERPQIDGERIVWHNFDGQDWEVMFLDLSKPFLPLNVSNNLDYDWGPQVSDELLVWRSNDGQDYEIVVASQNDPVAVQTVELTIIGDYTVEEDELFHVAIDGVTIDGITLGPDQEMYDDAQEAWGNIWIYNDDGELDYGDAPASYHTLIADNGARHKTHDTDSSQAVYYLGAGVDAEDDGQPSEDADGDDNQGQAGHPVQVDEDGVSMRSHWIPGEAVRLVVTATTEDSKEGYLTGWVDYDGDGNFGDDDGNVDREEQLEFIGPNERVSDGINLFYLLEYVDTDDPHEVRDGWVAVEVNASMSANEVAEKIADVINAQPAVDNVTIVATVAPGSNEVALEFYDATTDDLLSTSTIQASEGQEIVGPNVRVTDGTDIYHLLEYVDTNAPHDVRDGWVAVDIDASMSANEVAEAIADVINAQPDVKDVVPDVTVSITATVAAGSDEIVLEFRNATTGTLRSTSTIQADQGANILDPLTGPQVDKLGTGVSTFFVIVPDTVTLGDTYARFRFSSADGLNYLGSAPDGEVEDYLITITTDEPGIVITPTDGATEVVEGGVTDTYSVVLTAKPMNTVWVNIAGDLDVETTETRLRFTRDNWNIAQTVTVAAIDDDIAEFIPDPTDPTKSLPHEGELTHTVDSLDLAYNEMAVDPVIVEVTDNDLAKVQVFRTGGSTRVREGGLTDDYELVLTSEPTGNVFVHVDAGDQLLVSDGVLAPDSTLELKFTPGNWSKRQTVYVTAVDDLVAEGDPSVPLANREHPASITHSVNQLLTADDTYKNVGDGVDSVAVQIGDNDTPGISVSVDSVNVTEGGTSSGTYTIQLLSEPAEDVTVTLVDDSQVEATTTDSLVFTSSNWWTPQTVTVTAVDDSVAEGVHSGQVAHTVSSDDAFYDNLAAPAVGATITDNDSVDVVISKDSFTVSEDGQTDSYTVVLGSEPTADVTVTVGRGSQLTTDVETLVFTPSDWDTPQWVTVLAVDDDVAEGTHTPVLGHTVDSNDPAYDNFDVELRDVTITDNDTAYVDISAAGTTLQVAEGDSEMKYEVVLTSEPTSKVTVTLEGGDQISVVPSVIVFDPSDWDQTRTVTVRAVDDAIAEGDHSSLITHEIASADTQYSNLSPPPRKVNVSIADNDKADITIAQTAGSTNVSEVGVTDIYEVRLTSQPTSDVTVELQVDDQVKTLPSKLTFTPQNWNQAQTVAVSSKPDLIAEGDHTGTITHVMKSDDSEYSGLTPVELVVNVEDNDTANVVISQSDNSTSVTEGGASDDYTIVLTSQPREDVIITLTSGVDLSTAPAQLTFTANNWNQPQSVTVTAVDDLLVEGTEFHAIDHLVTSQDAVYNGFTVDQVAVEVADNDEQGTTGTLNLLGTTGDDTFELIRGDVLTVKLNNVTVYEGTNVHTVTFDGLDGYDEVDVTGSAEYEKATIAPTSVSLTNDNFSFTSENTEQSLIESGGGDDLVEITDSNGDDTVNGGPTQISISGNGFSHRADNFREAQVYARAGGYDTLELHDSAGKDKGKIETNDTAKLYNASYYIRGKFFEEIVMTSTGGADQLRAWDTPADDSVTASYEEVVIDTGTNLADTGMKRQKATIQGFEYVSLYATMGGDDSLTLNDSPGNDKLVMRQHKVTMFPRTDNVPYDYEVMGRSFDEVHARSAAGGVDVTRLHDTMGVDLLQAGFVNDDSWASLSRPVDDTSYDEMYEVLGFDQVSAINDYGDSPKNKKDVDAAIEFLMLDEDHWDDV